MVALVDGLIIRLNEEALSGAQVIRVLVDTERPLPRKDEVDQVIGTHGRAVRMAGMCHRMAECRQAEVACLIEGRIAGLYIFHDSFLPINLLLLYVIPQKITNDRNPFAKDKRLIFFIKTIDNRQ